MCLMLDATTGADMEACLEIIRPSGVSVTCWVDPARLVDRVDFWRGVAAEGHEIGNGALLDAASLDGRLGRWTLAMVSDELEEGKKLWAEVFGNGPEPAVAAPFGERLAHDGDYLNRMVENGVRACASDVAGKVAVWPAGTTKQGDLMPGILHAVHLTRSADNRLWLDKDSLREWSDWAANLPPGVATTFSAALGAQAVTKTVRT